MRGRARDSPLSPQTPYEQVGDVPNAVFPCAAPVDRPTGRVTLYDGAADTVLHLVHGRLDELVAFARS